MHARAATPADARALAAGMREVVDEGRMLLTERTISDEELRRRSEESTSVAAIAEGSRTFVLEQGDVLIGALGLHPANAPGVLSMGMWVLRSHRGEGGGRLLMEAAIADAESREDIHRLELEAFTDNLPAIALYESFGFEHEGVLRDRYRRLDGSLRSVVVMARLF